MARIEFLGCPVDNLCINDALDWMETRICRSEPGKILVVNANKLWLMSKDPRLDQIVKKAELIIPEYAVFWGAKKLGTPLQACVFGIALAQETLRLAQKKGYSLFFLGAKLSVVEMLVNKVQQEFPGLPIAGYHHGYIDHVETEKVVTEIRQAHPDILLVAMGSPKQEYWISDNFSKCNVPISMGIGGSFDVLAGIKKDTPSWARGHGLEWVYRLSQDPKSYWKRYLVTNSWMLWSVFKVIILRKTKTIQQSYSNKKSNTS